MGPPAGESTELQLAFAPFQAPEFASLNLVLQILGGLEQRGFERVVFGLGVQGWAVNQPRRVACMAGSLGMRTRSRNLQPDLDAEGRFGFPLVFEDHFGGSDRGQAMKVFELFLDLTVPGGLGVEAEVAKGGFHIRSGVGFWVHAIDVEKMVLAAQRRWLVDLIVATDESNERPGFNAAGMSTGSGVRNGRLHPSQPCPLRQP